MPAYDSPLLGNPRQATQRAPQTDYERWARGLPPAPAASAPVAATPAVVPSRVQPRVFSNADWCRPLSSDTPTSHQIDGWPVVLCSADSANKALRVPGVGISKYR